MLHFGFPQMSLSDIDHDYFAKLHPQMCIRMLTITFLILACNWSYGDSFSHKEKLSHILFYVRVMKRMGSGRVQ